ncbi:MAG TPA: hypothetical protein VMF65_22665 [Acidimicrobiales bacterium]|nr:hypothetical protein [Acidimicrobiales bacterium]
MSRLLLDATFLVEADRSSASLDKFIADDDEVAIAAVTVAELLVGVLLADRAHRRGRRQFVDEVKEIIPTVDYDATVAASDAELLVAVRRQGRPREPTTSSSPRPPAPSTGSWSRLTPPPMTACLG